MTLATQLLAVKELRMDRSERRLAAQKRVFAQAEAERADAQHRLEQCREEAAAHEARLYADLMSRGVFVKEIQDVRAELAKWQEAIERRLGTLTQAQRQRDAEEGQLRLDRADFVRAHRACDKAEQFATSTRMEEAAQNERAQEAQLEELVRLPEPKEEGQA